MSFFSVKNLTAGYGGEPILQEISFELEEGWLLGILGANGSGKTTLLKSVCGIVRHSGDCTLDGVSLEHQSPRHLARLCGYIPQRSGITIDISVLDVVCMGFNPWLGMLEQPTQAQKRQAMDAIRAVGLGGREQENFLTLSEGQRQLAIFARTLVGENKLLLLDEPESALDFHYRYQMLDELGEWRKNGRRAAIMALHDPALALNCCDAVLLLKDGKRLGLLRPGLDRLEDMEAMLSQVYGPVSLHRCRNRKGQSQLVMLRE